MRGLKYVPNNYCLWNLSVWFKFPANVKNWVIVSMVLILTFRHAGKNIVCPLLESKHFFLSSSMSEEFCTPFVALIISCCHYSYLQYLPSISTLLGHLIHLCIIILPSTGLAQKCLWYEGMEKRITLLYISHFVGGARIVNSTSLIQNLICP